MKIKQATAMLYCMACLMALLCVSASAAGVEPGVYTAGMVTSYYNPDTGNVDDGGTANAALGEGMCRSATDKTALVEVDRNGTVWVTVRLLLQSNCSNVAFYTRSGYDSYSRVEYSVPAEDAANDSIDYRIKVSKPGQKLKCTMYVAPMGRDVLWYLYVDTAAMQAGSGDFVVSIDTSAPIPAQEAPPAQTPETSQNPTPAGASKPVGVESPAEEAREARTETPQDAPNGDAGEDSPGALEAEQAAFGEDGEDAGFEGQAAGGEPALPGSSGLRGGVIAGIVAALAVIAGVVIYLVRRKKVT